MQTIREVDALRARIREWRGNGERIAFVPTMGNLHAGHLSLVKSAQNEADRVVASIFVNPTQFGPGEDFDRYPRTESEDAEKLEANGTDALFLPRIETMYPGGTAETTFVEVPGLSDRFCGAHRPGHFRGVATVVARLFNLVQPDVAVFGEKDYQQLLVIRRMTRDLAFPVEIVGVPTAREADGLAMSSRNQYLSADERRTAPVLHGVLEDTATKLRAGASDVERLEDDAMVALREAGFRPEYVAIRGAADLAEIPPGGESLVILAAAHLGRTRLIDNVKV